MSADHISARTIESRPLLVIHMWPVAGSQSNPTVFRIPDAYCSRPVPSAFILATLPYVKPGAHSSSLHTLHGAPTGTYLPHTKHVSLSYAHYSAHAKTYSCRTSSHNTRYMQRHISAAQQFTVALSPVNDCMVHSTTDHPTRQHIHDSDEILLMTRSRKGIVIASDFIELAIHCQNMNPEPQA